MAKKKRKDMRQDAGVPAPESALGVFPPAPSWRQDVYAPVTLVLLGLVFIYACIRAASLSIVHDEAITYFIQLFRSFAGVLTYAHPLMPNNHFLNTFLIKIFTGLFGSSEFVVRMPALLGCALYLTAVYRIGRVFLSGPRLLLGVALLTLHPFLMDFFSCSRGYALGVGLLAMGIYFLLCRIKEGGSRRDAKNTFWAASLSALSVFAHLTFINIYAAMLCVLAALEAREVFWGGQHEGSDAAGYKTFLTRLLVSFGPGLLFLAGVYVFFVPHILGDVELRLLEHDGMWSYTIGGLVEATAYGKTAFAQGVFSAAIIVILALAGLSCCVLVVRWIKKKPLSRLDHFLLCLAGLLLIYSLLWVFQHKALKMAYPCARWVISYIPLLLLLVVVLAEGARRNRKAFLRIPGTALFYLFSSALCLHYLTCLNITHFHIWKYDAATKEMLATIWDLEKGNAPADRSIQLNCDWLFDPTIGFYIYTQKYWWLTRERPPEEKDVQPDYYYYTDEREDILYGKHLELVKKSDVSGAWLARPKRRRARALASAQGGNASVDGRSAAERDKEEAEKFLATFTLDDGPVGYTKRGHGWAKGKNWEAAIVDFSKAIELNPDAYVAYVNRGMVYANMGQLDMALADLNEALLIKPRLVEGLDTRGYVHYRRREFAAALSDLDRSIELDVEQPSAYHHRGLVYVAMGEVENGLKDLDKALVLEPAFSAAAYDRALLYLEQGRTEEAIADLTLVIEEEPDNGLAYRYRGRAYDVLGDTGRAKRDLEKAGELGV